MADENMHVFEFFLRCIYQFHKFLISFRDKIAGVDLRSWETLGGFADLGTTSIFSRSIFFNDCLLMGRRQIRPEYRVFALMVFLDERRNFW